MAGQIKHWAQDLGFAEARITRAELPPEAEQQLATWLAAAYHGEMDYMARHGALRVRPAELVPGTLRVISLRMHYWPESAADAEQVLTRPQQAYISRYALGRDYHKVLRNRLQKLAEQISAAVPEHQFRVFTDSAPLARFTWPVGEARWSIPSRSFEDGKNYLLQRPGQSIRLRIHKTAAPLDNPAALAAWMARSGCKAQALSVLAKLAEE